jgi:hypothetical protein
MKPPAWTPVTKYGYTGLCVTGCCQQTLRAAVVECRERLDDKGKLLKGIFEYRCAGGCASAVALA